MEQLFAEQGSPNTVYSDNGPQYSSREFREFSKLFGFQHITSSPYHPKSNGIAERHVQTVKGLLRKCAGNFTKFQVGLRTLRATPIDSALPSPAELLYGRKIDLLPRRSGECDASANHRGRLEYRQQRQREEHNARVRDGHKAPVMSSGDKVYTRNKVSNCWERGTITGEGKTPASYLVQQERCSRARGWSVFSEETECTPRVVRRTAEDIRPDPQVTRSGRVSRAPVRLTYNVWP